MMAVRIDRDVARGAPLTIFVDGVAVSGFAGETVATAMLAAGLVAFRRDTAGRLRGLFCNMGTCGECTVMLAASGRRVRACTQDATDRLEVTTLG